MMGYSTDFIGNIEITPPLNQQEINYLNTFFQARHDTTYDNISPQPKGFIPYNNEMDIKPGAWCDWKVTADGNSIAWNGSEKSYRMTGWLSFIVNHFIGNDPIAPKVDKTLKFFQPHILNGVIEAQGEDEDDQWYIVVMNNHVMRCDPEDYEKLQLKTYMEDNLPEQKRQLKNKI